MSILDITACFTFQFGITRRDLFLATIVSMWAFKTAIQFVPLPPINEYSMEFPLIAMTAAAAVMLMRMSPIMLRERETLVAILS